MIENIKSVTVKLELNDPNHDLYTNSLHPLEFMQILHTFKKMEKVLENLILHLYTPHRLRLPNTLNLKHKKDKIGTKRAPSLPLLVFIYLCTG